MLNHALAQVALRTRLLTLSGTYTLAKENEQFSPTVGQAYIEEQYTPGTTSQIAVGPNGTVENRPMYGVIVWTPEGLGITAANTFRDALLALFPPRLAITLSDGTALRVRTDTGPYMGQMLRRKPGWVASPVTFPLVAYTQNSI